MTEKILIIMLPLIFLVTFIARNLIVKAKIQQKIRSSDILTTISITLSTLCILVTIFSVFSELFYRFTGALLSMRSPVVSYVGFFLFGVSIIMGWITSAQLKESWRVGVQEDNKTELIQSGIYAYIRNPYFFFYFIMFFSLFLIRPSIVMIALVITAIMAFHKMVLKEELFLMNVHGTEYEQYRNRTGRYMPRSIKNQQTT